MLLGGAGSDEERRDLSVILMHCGELEKAAAEMRAYRESAHYRAQADGFEKALCSRMMQALDKLELGTGGGYEPLSVAGVLAGPTPEQVELVDKKMPLTW